jgi:cell division protein ZapA (FtsZ GTPase activity inhibitor)
MADHEQGFRVEIYDRVYHLRSAAEEKYTRQLAKSVDAVMRSIAEKTQTVDSLRVAVLAALHFADQHERLKQRYEKLNGMVSEKSLKIREALETARKDAVG